MNFRAWWMVTSMCSVSAAAIAQTPPLQPLPESTIGTLRTLPAPAPGPLMVRVNGARAITAQVFPAVVNAAGGLDRSIARKTILDDEKWTLGAGTPFETGIKVDTWLSNIVLRVPVTSDTWTASFAPGGEQAARINSIFASTGASLSLVFHVRTEPVSAITDLLPGELRRWIAFSETVAIRLTGVGSALDVVLAPDGARLKVRDVPRFQLNVVKANVEDSGPLTEFADAVLGWDALFNVVGATDANSAARLLLNKLLAEDLGLDDKLKDAANQALKTFPVQTFLNQELAIGSGAFMAVTPTLERLESANNWLLTGWKVGLDAKPDDAVPGLQRRFVMPPAESVGATPTAGDIQVFVPFSLVDHALYEIIQAGVLRSVLVPPATSGGVGNGFRTHVVPTESPRLQRDPGNASQLLLAFEARLEAVSTGTGGGVTVPSIDGAPARVESAVGAAARAAAPASLVTLNGVTTVNVFMRLAVRENSGLGVDIVRVRLPNLAGELRVATVVTDLAPHRSAIESAVDNQIRARVPQVKLLDRSVNLLPPLRAQMGAVTFGPAYVRVPISIVGG